MSGWRVGIDTGGTFTDLVAVDRDTMRIAKVPSTPPDFEIGVLNAIEEAGIPLPDVELLAHGTTVATNAIIVAGGAPTALLTTKGFRDVLELRRHNRAEPFDIMWDPPDPLVQRRHRYEIGERLDYSGAVVTPLHEEDVRAAVADAQAQGIGSFAICFLHSYVNPAHEQAAAAIVQQLAPEAAISASSDLLREPHEFERTSTTAINAYLVPVVASYLRSLSESLRARGFRGRLGVMHSGGGLLSVDTAARFPARLVTSGPAAGAMAAEGLAGSGSPAAGVAAVEGLARAARLDQVISLDIGGTSADIAVIRGGRARLVNEYSPQFGQVIRFPAVDLITIGAGGGSVAWRDEGGLPHVGPRSAGALPGPAAYARGGVEATVTDANVVLGRLGAEVALAGGLTLDADRALAAVRRFGDALGLDSRDAALGVLDIVNNNMARSIRLVTVERGLDPREYALVPFGGAGPLLAVELAELLDMRRVVIPVAPGVTSALGCLHVDIAHDLSEALIVRLADLDTEALRERVSRLEAEMRSRLEEEGVEEAVQRVEVSLDVRYAGQIRALTVAISGSMLGPGLRDELAELFFEEYERQFHFATRDIELELAGIRVRGTRRVTPPQIVHRPHAAAAPSTRRVDTRQGAVEARVLDRDGLSVGTRVDGPAIVTQLDSTTWVPPGWAFEVDPAGNLCVERR